MKRIKTLWNLKGLLTFTALNMLVTFVAWLIKQATSFALLWSMGYMLTKWITHTEMIGLNVSVAIYIAIRITFKYLMFIKKYESA